ncbi:hypothetical protein ACG5V6_21290 [Streptomyces chitinivorans]|uniref:Uncharacterized protein n=1 Tax=Streptomyces chitinivorans TaxID=1257027 RepID=A0ABW7HZH7_9ACTN|nr:hypothetical protein [Streptomyces chitinivorans]MDH2410913.1 hypothetical protein [Streptomyces chitinivorans]
MACADPGAGGHRGRPVFVDATGRRGRVLRILGWSFGTLCGGCVAVLAVALTGGSPAASDNPAVADRPAPGGATAESGPPALLADTQDFGARRHWGGHEGPGMRWTGSGGAAIDWSVGTGGDTATTAPPPAGETSP